MAHETVEPPTGPSSGEHPDRSAQLATDPAEAGQQAAAAEAPTPAAPPAAAEATTATEPPAAEAATATESLAAAGTVTATEPPTAAETGPAVAPAEGAPPAPAKPAKHRKLLYVTLPGCWGAIIFAALSFTPSLLPRGGLIQGIICGITAAIWRAFADREPRQPRR